MSNIRLPSNNQSFWKDPRVKDIWAQMKSNLRQMNDYKTKKQYIENLRKTQPTLSLWEAQLIWEKELKAIERQGREQLYDIYKLILAERKHIEEERLLLLQMEEQHLQMEKQKRTLAKKEREAAEAMLKLAHPESFAPRRSTRIANKNIK